MRRKFVESLARVRRTIQSSSSIFIIIVLIFSFASGFVIILIKKESAGDIFSDSKTFRSEGAK
jgi:hypothetical protein